MAVKQPVNLNFAQGLETKTDPYQIPVGKFTSLVNSVFTQGGRLTKRNGFGALPALPDTTSLYLTTFNGDLTAVGSKLQAYSSSTKTWVNRGVIEPVGLSVQTLIRNNLNQSQCDSAISPNGLICTVYTEVNAGVNSYKFAVAEADTGQSVIAPTAIAGADSTFGTPRVFAMTNYFIIVYTNKVSSTYHLKYLPINSASLVVGTATDITTSYTPSASLNFDGVVFNNTLYLAWNGASASGIKMAYLTSTLALTAAVVVDASHVATVISVCADFQNQVIWASYYDSGSGNAFGICVDSHLNNIIGPTGITGGIGTILNFATAAANGVCDVFFETQNAYGYDSAVPTNYVQRIQLLQAGGLPGIKIIARSVGLASKAFSVSGSIYFLSAYSSPYQPTYFLMDASGKVLAKLAYGNGGGYLKTGLPSVAVSGNEASVAYLFKDLIAAVNKNTNVPAGSQTAGIYSQTGVNVAHFTIGTESVSTAEIGSNLNITGGFLWGYDGYSPTENNFFVWPDSIEATTSAAAVTPTGTVTSGSNVITAVSSFTGVGLGASVSGTAIPANQVITGFSVANSTITFGPLTATGSHSAETITVTGNISTAQQYYYQATYEWTDNQGNAFRSAPSIPIAITTTGTTSANTVNVPTLRLTYKTANPVKLVLYRWSTAHQVYYQVTSLTSPTLNDPTIDSVSIVDCLDDSTIVGNNILYTTGGVVEDVGPPSFKAVFPFDDRLWGIPSEDPNSLWFSKQVIEGTPVEMSDALTEFVAPAIGAQGPTGELNCGAAMDDKVVLFKSRALYYINGTGPDNTGANSQYSQPTFITSMVGCSNQNSIVFQPQGLMFEFASEAGNQIWLLGRDLSTQYIGAPVEALTMGASVTSAVAVPGTNQVRFNLSSGVTLMYDYYYQQWGSFSIGAISSTILGGLHTYVNSRGAVFRETPGLYLDGTSPVLLSFTTGWLNIAGLRGYQRIYQYSFLGTYYSPHKLVVQTGYDYGPASHQATYSPPNFSPVFGADPVFGSGSPFGGPSNIEQFRVQTKVQKCKAFQISVQEIYDPSFGVAAGAGLSLSGINLVIGVKKGWSPQSGRNSVG